MRIINNISGATALVPTRALIVYEAQEPTLRQQGAVAATLHNIVVGQIAAGKPLDEQTYVDFVRGLRGNNSAGREILPPDVLYAGGDALLWHVPAKRRLIWFRTGRKEFDADLNAKAVFQPALLFLASPSNLYVWALASDERPDPETALFLAPYFNLYVQGHMCPGNVALPKTVTVGDIPNWEKYFFDTEFTHSNYSGMKLTTHPGGHDALWRRMRTWEPWRGFPTQYLVPAPANVLAHRGDLSSAPQLTVREALNEIA